MSGYHPNSLLMVQFYPRTRFVTITIAPSFHWLPAGLATSTDGIPLRVDGYAAVEVLPIFPRVLYQPTRMGWEDNLHRLAQPGDRQQALVEEIDGYGNALPVLT